MRASKTLGFLAAAALSCFISSARAAFIVQVDTDGSSAGSAGTLNSHVSFTGTTTTHGGFSIAATAVGLNPGNSIFGGNATTVDQYVFTYTVGTDADNFIYSESQNL